MGTLNGLNTKCTILQWDTLEDTYGSYCGSQNYQQANLYLVSKQIATKKYIEEPQLATNAITHQFNHLNQKNNQEQKFDYIRPLFD